MGVDKWLVGKTIYTAAFSGAGVFCLYMATNKACLEHRARQAEAFKANEIEDLIASGRTVRVVGQLDTEDGRVKGSYLKTITIASIPRVKVINSIKGTGVELDSLQETVLLRPLGFNGLYDQGMVLSSGGPTEKIHIQDVPWEKSRLILATKRVFEIGRKVVAIGSLSRDQEGRLVLGPPKDGARFKRLKIIGGMDAVCVGLLPYLRPTIYFMAGLTCFSLASLSSRTVRGEAVNIGIRTVLSRFFGLPVTTINIVLNFLRDMMGGESPPSTSPAPSMVQVSLP